MARSNGSVRIGPISLFALVIVLCLAVMALLAFTTAQANLSLVERQANSTKQLYEDELAAQTFVANLDEQLVQMRDEGTSRDLAVLEEKIDQVVSMLYGTVSVSADLVSVEKAYNLSGTVATSVQKNAIDPLTGVHAQFVAEDGRDLDVVLLIHGNATYEILCWKVTTEWPEQISTDTLWTG